MKNLRLTFLGSGSAFTLPAPGEEKNWQSNMLFQSPDEKGGLLLDCGGDARHALHELGLGYLDLQGVYISHEHNDHTGGLEFLAFASKFDPRYTAKYGQPNLILHESLVGPLWENTLRGGLGSLQMIVANLATYFNVVSIPPNGSFRFGGVEFMLVQTIHIMDGRQVVPSYGLMFEVNGLTVFITTDTQHCPNQIGDFYKKADIIFQDCETMPFKSGVHAHFSELDALPPEFKAKMWLYHYQSGKKPDAAAHGFRGYVQKGQLFDFTVPETLTSTVLAMSQDPSKPVPVKA